MSSDLVKACSDIWFRLFDHRPFLAGEIKQLVKDFEDLKEDRDIDKLLGNIEWSADVKENQVDRTLSNLPKLEKINVLLDIANQNSVTILENEKNYSVDLALEAKRAARKIEWDKFTEDIDSKYTKIEETFRGKELELTLFYRDLESKLHVQQ